MGRGLIFAGAVLMLLAGCDFIGGADTLVRGSNNFISKEGEAAAVAYALARLETTPEVTDADLAAIYANIRERALAGELDATRVMLQLARMQRAPDAEETDEDG